MRLFRSLVAGTRLAMRRVWATRGLTVGIVLSMAALMGLWVGIPLYAESAASRLLSAQVGDAESDATPFGYLFSFNRLSGGNQEWSALEPVTGYLSDPGTSFGSSVDTTQLFVETIAFPLMSAGESATARVSFTSLTGFESAVAVVEGRQAVSLAATDLPIEAMVSAQQAESMGLSVGQSLTLGEGTEVHIVGTWAPLSGDVAGSRFLSSGAMMRSLVVPEPTMAGAVDGLGGEVISNAQWLVLLEAGRVTTGNVSDLLARTDQVNREVDDRLSGTRLLLSPAASLEGFQAQVSRLNAGLVSFATPTLVLGLAAVVLLLSMKQRRRRQEISILRSRGVSAPTLIGGSVVEALVLSILAAGLGVFLAQVVATFIGRTETFLRLGDGVELSLVFNGRAVRTLLLGVVVLVLIQVLSTIRVFRWPRDTGSRSTASLGEAPWWQRSYVDVFVVLAVVLFSAFILRSEALSGDLLDDPIVLLLPAAISIAAGLVLLRLFPSVMGALARLLDRTDSTALLLVARRSARVSGALIAPLMLLVITGALSVYTASLARTLDLQLLDAAYHEVGATNSVVDDAEQNRQVFDLINGSPVPRLGASGSVIGPNAYGQVWGLESATRIAQLPGRAEGPGGDSAIPIEFTGVDPETFLSTAFWRDDYASESLATLMRRLEATPDSVLMHTRALALNDLRLGDTIDVTVTTGSSGVDVPMVIVGSFSQFPTWLPSADLTPVVGVLADFEQRLGHSVSRRVLFDESEQVIDDGQTRADFNRLGIGSSSIERAPELIEQAQQRPERQGVFGLLTVSFVFSSLLTLLGFVFYAAFGFTQQLTELGTLRALGLRRASLMGVVGLDLLSVAVAGIGTAVATGLGMARFVMPRLIGTSAGAAPDLLQEVDWRSAMAISLLLLATFLVVTALVLLVLRRIRLFEAIKIGATP